MINRLDKLLARTNEGVYSLLEAIINSMGLFACITLLIGRFFPGRAEIFLMGLIIATPFGLLVVHILQQRAQVVNKNQAEQD